MNSSSRIDELMVPLIYIGNSISDGMCQIHFLGGDSDGDIPDSIQSEEQQQK
jgi:hypothetical protein